MNDEEIRHFYELVAMFHQLCGDFKKAKNIEDQKKILNQCRFLIDAGKTLIADRTEHKSSAIIPIDKRR